MLLESIEKFVFDDGFLDVSCKINERFAVHADDTAGVGNVFFRS